MTTTSAARTARERVREQMTAEILRVAREHVARDGAAALSVRSIARDLGLAPSALYRYFDGRDALLSALILGAYESLAECAERAVDDAGRTGSSDRVCWFRVASAMRVWAVERPHEWGLIFGTPVPGYEAPSDTVVPYTRVAAALVRPLVEAKAAGHLRAPVGTAPVSDALAAALQPVSQGLFPDMPFDKVVLAVQAWSTLVGCISLEVFGHWRNTLLDPAAFFERTVGDLADAIGLS